MCRCLKISRAGYYKLIKKEKLNSKKNRKLEAELVKDIKEIFQASKKTYGSRRIKKELELKGKQVSRRKIRKIMKRECLESVYTKKKYKVQSSKTNKEDLPNLLEQNFTIDKPLKVIVADLTYIKVRNSWKYACIISDLFNREIIGYSVGEQKNANLVKLAFNNIKYRISDIEIFHTDRGSEFNNKLINDILNLYNIKKSSSRPGCPYDNAVAESIFKAIKTEFVLQNTFKSLEELDLKLFDYINWWNKQRLHSTLGYVTPQSIRMQCSASNLF